MANVAEGQQGVALGDELVDGRRAVREDDGVVFESEVEDVGDHLGWERLSGR